MNPVRAVQATIFAAFMLATVSTAQGQEDAPQVREARARFATGEQLYEAGAYAQSLREFRQVYDLLREANHPRAALVLFNVARCFVASNRERDAVTT